MSRKRGVNVLNDKLKEEYPFLKRTKTDSDVRCEQCNREFSIAHSGRADIVKHVKSTVHQDACRSASTSRTVTHYFKSATMSKEDIHIAACEGVWAYHVINSNHSFRSADCSSKIIRNCFEMAKFTCGRTKCEAIATGVFAPYAASELETDLKECDFFTIITDASNHGSIKMFPVVVRFFSEKFGVKIRIIELTSAQNETSDTVVALLNAAMEKFGIQSKLVGFCGDNAPLNFGNMARTSKNNTYYKLNLLYEGLIGVGCGAHVVHNTLKKGCDKFPFDVECIVVKIYSHFYLFSVRVATLMEFCQSVDVEYQKLLGYSKTRFLALLSAVDSILRIFDGLKAYFLESGSSPAVLKQFFEDPMAKVWLIFIRDQVSYN